MIEKWDHLPILLERQWNYFFKYPILKGLFIKNLQKHDKVTRQKVKVMLIFNWFLSSMKQYHIICILTIVNLHCKYSCLLLYKLSEKILMLKQHTAYTQKYKYYFIYLSVYIISTLLFILLTMYRKLWHANDPHSHFCGRYSDMESVCTCLLLRITKHTFCSVMISPYKFPRNKYEKSELNISKYLLEKESFNV